MAKKKKKVYEPKPYVLNFGYTIIETKSLQEGIDFIRTLPKPNSRDRKHNLANLAEIDPKCVCCGRVGTKFCLGQGKFAGAPNRGDDLHWDLYTSDDVALNIDHIHPKSKGGENHLSNYQILCIECNSFKGNKPTNLIPYKALLDAKISVVPMVIATKPYLLVDGGKQLDKGLYEGLSEWLDEVRVDGEYRYFLIDIKKEET
jgi:5-methylcytosine-specific restriction endonuclease McrA